MFNLNERLDYLETLDKEQVWYIVKQEMEFWKVCYAVSILEEYIQGKVNNVISDNLETYFSRRCEQIKNNKGFNKFITTHRMLLHGYMYGLIRKNGSRYDSATVTDVFKEIKNKCKGDFEKINLYYYLIEQQIEKLYFSSSLDEEYQGKRKQYRLYPLFLMYKVLNEIGKITGKYEISKDEYIVFVCSSETYSTYLDTVFNIMAYRDAVQNGDTTTEDRVKNLSRTFKDIRFQRVLQSIETIVETNDGFKIDNDYIDYVADKIHLYEISNKKENNYINLLTSNESLLRDKENEEELNISMDIYKDIEQKKINEDISRNLIIYGAPGTGKSYSLEKDRDEYFKDERLYTRVTFNPSYTYYNFVGSYKPSPIYIKKYEDKDEYYKSNMKDKLECQMMPSINYSFEPGPFVEILCRALNNPEYNFLLIIEEINRADAAAVFGDIFQLIDREKDKTKETYGSSIYGINLGKDAMDYLAIRVNNESENFKKDEFVKIPSNLYIWCTMNSADQNVNKMDTAFKRRWDFRYIDIDGVKNREDEERINKIKIKFNSDEGSIDMKWEKFRMELNKQLENIEVGEDKFIGPYFITDIDENNYISEDAIKYKLLMYLKDDVLRYNPTDLFKENYSFGSLIKAYESNKVIFNEDFIAKLKDKNSRDE